jgi:hypothetical protein
MSYASGTGVSVEQSKAEIERILQRVGASSFQSGWHQESRTEHILFRVGESNIMLAVTMPPAGDFLFSPRGRRRTKDSAEDAFKQERRRRWRGMLLIIKAKLEQIEIGNSTLQREFLSDMVMPNGRTLGDALIPQLKELQAGRLALPAHEPGR